MEGKKYIFFIATLIVVLAASSSGFSRQYHYNNTRFNTTLPRQHYYNNTRFHTGFPKQHYYNNTGYYSGFPKQHYYNNTGFHSGFPKQHYYNNIGYHSGNPIPRIPRQNYYYNNINHYARAAEDKSHHLIIGQRERGDTLLSTILIDKSSRFLSIVSYEETFNVQGFITHVAVHDQKTNGNGAYVTLVSGGSRLSQSLRLRFKSQRGHGIHFVVLIYGYNNRKYNGHNRTYYYYY